MLGLPLSVQMAARAGFVAPRVRGVAFKLSGSRCRTFTRRTEMPPDAPECTPMPPNAPTAHTPARMRYPTGAKMHPNAPRCTRMHPHFAIVKNEPTAITLCRPDVPSTAQKSGEMCRNVPSTCAVAKRTHRATRSSRQRLQQLLRLRGGGIDWRIVRRRLSLDESDARGRRAVYARQWRVKWESALRTGRSARRC